MQPSMRQIPVKRPLSIRVPTGTTGRPDIDKQGIALLVWFLSILLVSVNCLLIDKCHMEKINWDNDFLLGIEKFDEQHRGIIEIINELVD